MNIENQTRNLVLTAVFAAIIIIMAFVPYLGYIPLGFMNATIIHIPVIIGAILLGPKNGGFLGLVFGFTSLWKNTFMPNPTSFVFSPFVTIGGYGGNFGSLVICLAPRFLIGLIAFLVYKGMMKILNNQNNRQEIALVAAGVAGSLTNTLLVMNLIYLLFGEKYAAASDWAKEGIYGVIMGIIGIQGVPEAIIAGLLTMIITKSMMKAMKY